MDYCIHGPPRGVCTICNSTAIPQPMTPFTLPPQPMQPMMGCVCPPTSEKTCESPVCPRKNHFKGNLSQGT
jgi:hypothetical protein